MFVVRAFRVQRGCLLAKGGRKGGDVDDGRGTGGQVVRRQLDLPLAPERIE